MAITPLPGITPLPVLVESDTPDGTLHRVTKNPNRYRITYVRIATGEEVFDVMDQWKISHPERWACANGIDQLQKALREPGDWASFRSAIDLVQQEVPPWQLKGIRESKNWETAAWAYSGVMSGLLQDSRFVIWYSIKGKGGPQPGLYCPSWKDAVYAFLGMGRIRFCKKPSCGKPFIPRTTSDPRNEQRYCPGDKCANAARVARWKVLHPEEAKKQRQRHKGLPSTSHENSYSLARR